jgi:hypothetical protein
VTHQQAQAVATVQQAATVLQIVVAVAVAQVKTVHPAATADLVASLCATHSRRGSLYDYRYGRNVRYANG